ncbi:MAG TPA: bifunctional oligoribonuclease/PAP phosphatase NrnA [Gemmataceae bacterium]|nr:bifunctional oligoribonuclease/PAP phosphatase NrnA [Gemmataceae bacterium]
MPVDWAPFVALVRGNRRFLLTTHVRPDGDGLGSMLALADALEHHGKQVRLVIPSTMPPRYAFLDPQGRVRRFEPPGDEYRETDVALVLDTGTWNQLDGVGPFFRELPAAKAVIDHHLTQDDLGGLRLVDTSAEATGRLIHEAITALGGPLTPAAAASLFVALAMDTGWFRHGNTTARTFALASELVAAGARPEVLYDQLFESNSLGRLRLMGLVLDRLRVAHGGRVAHTEIRRGDYEAVGAMPPDSEDLVNFTRSVAGVEVGLLFMEQPRGGVKVSLRSRGAVDVARLAERFGGGGHRQAAGATLPDPLEAARARVLDAVAAALAPLTLPAPPAQGGG